MTMPPSVVEWPRRYGRRRGPRSPRSRSRPNRTGGLHIGDARWSNDERRPAIEHRVPDAAGVVIGGCIWRDDVTGECAAQPFDLAAR
jgi:hypothetical protein